MKKILIKELDEEKRNNLIKNNHKLIENFLEGLYEEQLQQQYEVGTYIMNNQAQEAIKYHDHYYSFFYTLIDWRKFITNIDKDYLTTEALEIYNHIMDKLETLDNMDPYCENYYNLDEHLESETKKVLKDLEDFLHTFEEYPDEDDAIRYAEEMDLLDDYYIEEQDDGTTDGVIRKDIFYTETYI